MKNLILLIIPFLLSSCFVNEPNQIEIEQAMTIYFQEKFLFTDGTLLNQAISEIIGINFIQFHSIEKISCVSSNLTSATCEVAYDFTLGKQDNPLAILLGGAGRHKGVDSYRFVKSSKGWIVAS
jgi:hypothetical protein